MTAPPGPIVDCHVHLVEPDRFPPPDGPGHRPRPHETATSGQLDAVMARHGTGAAVIVPLSGYGTDHRPVLAAVAADPARRRGIVTFDPDAGDEDLDRLAARGIVGIRLNVFNHGRAAIDVAARASAAAEERGWIVQVQCPAPLLAEIAGHLHPDRVPVVLDHLGMPDVAAGPDAPAVSHILRLGAAGAYLKLSGAFRLSRRPPPHDDLDPFVERLLRAFPPDRRIWGSDWPFVATSARPTYDGQMATVRRWLSDPQALRTALVETPARLFGFAVAAQTGTMRPSAAER